MNAISNFKKVLKRDPEWIVVITPQDEPEKASFDGDNFVECAEDSVRLSYVMQPKSKEAVLDMTRRINSFATSTFDSDVWEHFFVTLDSDETVRIPLKDFAKIAALTLTIKHFKQLDPIELADKIKELTRELDALAAGEESKG